MLTYVSFSISQQRPSPHPSGHLDEKALRLNQDPLWQGCLSTVDGCMSPEPSNICDIHRRVWRCPQAPSTACPGPWRTIIFDRATTNSIPQLPRPSAAMDLRSSRVDGMVRNRWTASIGTGGRHVGIGGRHRWNTQHACDHTRGTCLALTLVLLRIASAEPPRPIVVRVDEVGRAEAVTCEAATARADPLDPTTKYFLNRFIADFHSRRRATVEEQWARSLRFLSTELANAAFASDGAEVAAMAAGTADTEVQADRALGAEDIRHRRIASPTVLMRRLLSLDYVLEHPDLPWLPTEPEKVGAFETLGIERGLPSRLYRGAAGSTRRYFPLKLPVALDGDPALFVYADPGHDTPTAFSTWADAHGCLWEALAERHRSVEVVTVVRTDKEFDRAEAILQRRVRAAGPSEASGDVREELARIDRAILRGTVPVLEEFGGL